MVIYNALSDGELVALLKAEDELAFKEIYHRHWKMCYRLALKVINDDDLCSDALQDIFVWLWVNRLVSNISSLKAYLNAAVKYKMLNLIRQGKAKAEVYGKISMHEVPVDSLEEEQEVKELTNIILEFTAQLPAQAKEIFRLSRYEHLSNREIAERMKISEKTVKNQINICLKKLKVTLGRLSFWALFL